MSWAFAEKVFMKGSLDWFLQKQQRHWELALSPWLMPGTAANVKKSEAESRVVL
jgi:hypothetical protein